jgi:hypothetical protein
VTTVPPRLSAVAANTKPVPCMSSGAATRPRICRRSYALTHVSEVHNRRIGGDVGRHVQIVLAHTPLGVRSPPV